MPCLASDLTSNYECDTCSQKYSNDIVSDLTQELENMLAMTETYDCPGLEFLLQVRPTVFMNKEMNLVSDFVTFHYRSCIDSPDRLTFLLINLITCVLLCIKSFYL